MALGVVIGGTDVQNQDILAGIHFLEDLGCGQLVVALGREVCPVLVDSILDSISLGGRRRGLGGRGRLLGGLSLGRRRACRSRGCSTCRRVSRARRGLAGTTTAASQSGQHKCGSKRQNYLVAFHSVSFPLVQTTPTTMSRTDTLFFPSPVSFYPSFHPIFYQEWLGKA